MDADCNPTGTTGEWHGITGPSSGWQELAFDLSAYAGQDVELHITYASDWAVQDIGMFVDEVQLGGEPVESFESGLGAFTATSAPGSATPANTWTRLERGTFPEAPAPRSDDTLYFGFGFEGIADAADRNAVMDRAMAYLGN